MEEAGARRGRKEPPPPHVAGRYETAFRVIGRYMDEQKPRDVFFFEQDGAFVVRLLMTSQAGRRHELAEFTADDISNLVAAGPSLRHKETKPETKSDAKPAAEPPVKAQPDPPSSPIGSWRYAMKALKTVAVALGVTLAALIVIPLAVLAGLFVWLKLTEEADEEILELDQETTV